MPDPAPLAIRVFISSTFADMQAEREELVKRVFPELRDLCEERGVTFTEVDLRWGVTDEAKAEGRVLPICLEEIRGRGRRLTAGHHRGVRLRQERSPRRLGPAQAPHTAGPCAHHARRRREPESAEWTAMVRRITAELATRWALDSAAPDEPGASSGVRRAAVSRNGPRPLHRRRRARPRRDVRRGIRARREARPPRACGLRTSRPDSVTDRPAVAPRSPRAR